MKRVILDTNIYGLIVIDKERLGILEKLSASKNISVCGNSVIRKELQNTPKGFILGINLRNDLIRIFDNLAGEKEFEITKDQQNIAGKYYSEFICLGSKMKKSQIINDFLIVANASAHRMDIVVSEDRWTMLSEYAIKAYSIVNDAMKLRTPQFISYENFKSMVKKE
jgi:hypothetical protein